MQRIRTYILKHLILILRTYDIISFKGKVRLIATRPGTSEVVEIKEIDNLMPTVAAGLIGDILIAESGYEVGITYCALGSSTTTPALGDTTLTNEGGGVAMRKTITNRTRAGNVVTLSTYFTAAECTLNIKEIGHYGYPATAVVDTGTLFNHALISYDNSGGTVDLTFECEITININ